MCDLTSLRDPNTFKKAIENWSIIAPAPSNTKGDSMAQLFPSILFYLSCPA